MGKRANVIIVGGGFAGLAAAKRLSPRRVRATLIDRRAAFEFLPNIHEIVSGVKDPAGLRIGHAENLRALEHRFVRDEVTEVDPVARQVSLRGGSALAYDSLILATGGIDATRGVPGVVEHAFPFKSVDECARIGERLRTLADAGRPARVVVVGGGLEGVEALGEILRRHRTNARFEIALVEARDRLLPEAPERIDPYLRELCAPYAVTFHTDSPVAAIEPDVVTLADGTDLASDLTIWTGGPGPAPALTEWGLASEGGWAPARQDLASSLQHDIFVAGDAATLPSPVARQAYHALDMGDQAARNVERGLCDRAPRPFQPSEKPTLISFGDLSCIAVTDTFVLAGPPLGAAKEAVFQLVMSQLDHRSPLRRLTRALQRSERANRKLLWPAVSSLESLRRQAEIRVL